jgi:glycosyltransferase involved in cell wall biosynthesis
MTTRIGISLHVYNEIERIERAINSLKSQDTSFLCVISDNSSTDGTYDFLSELIWGDNRFFLLRQPKHVTQMQNFIACVDYLMPELNENDFIMHFAADDILDEEFYLRRLLSEVRANPEIQVLAPRFRIVNAQSGRDRIVSLRFTSRISALRLLKLSFSPSESGRFNVVSSLMSKRAFQFWFDTYRNCSIEDSQSLVSRAIRSEFVAIFSLVRRYRVFNCDDVTYTKEVHNRINLVTRSDKQFVFKSHKSKWQLIRHQLSSFSTPLKAVRISKVALSRPGQIYYALFGIVYFFVNLGSLIVLVSIRRLRNF